MCNVIRLRCFASLSIASQSMRAVVYAVLGVRQPHLILTATYSTRLHYILPIKISMQFPVKCEQTVIPWESVNTGWRLHMATHTLWQHALSSLPPPSHTQWTVCLDRQGHPLGVVLQWLIYFFNVSCAKFYVHRLLGLQYRGLCSNQWLIDINVSK